MAWLFSVDRQGTPWQLFGIPIHIEASWFLIVSFIAWSLARGYFPSTYVGLPAGLYWAMGVLAALLLYLCVLLHELGHSVVARGYGIPVRCVTLFMFGGVAQIARDAQRPAVELQVALAGPLVSALIAGACFAASRHLPAHHPLEVAAAGVVHYLAVINTGLIVFNLLPGFPLDGGRVLRAALWAWTGSLRRATRIASTLGSFLGIGLLMLGGWALTQGAWTTGMWYLLLGMFLRRMARASYDQAAWMDA